MPLVAAIGLVIALITFVFSLLVPLPLKFITVPLAVAGAIVAGAAFYMGDELQFINVMRLGRFVEKNRVTSETRTDY